MQHVDELQCVSIPGVVVVASGNTLLFYPRFSFLLHRIGQWQTRVRNHDQDNVAKGHN